MAQALKLASFKQECLKVSNSFRFPVLERTEDSSSLGMSVKQTKHKHTDNFISLVTLFEKVLQYKSVYFQERVLVVTQFQHTFSISGVDRLEGRNAKAYYCYKVLLYFLLLTFD